MAKNMMSPSVSTDDRHMIPDPSYVKASTNEAGDLIQEVDITALESRTSTNETVISSVQANKANQTDLDTTNTSVDGLQAKINLVSPLATYATLAALQTALPTGNANIYVTSDKRCYSWNGSAWVLVGTCQRGLNLYDKSKITSDCYPDANGSIVVSASYFISDYIYLDDGQANIQSAIVTNGTVATRSARYMHFFDANKTFIAGSRVDNMSTTAIPSGAKFVVLTYAIAYKLSDIMLIYGNSVTPITAYEGYTEILRPTPVFRKISDIVKSIFTGGVNTQVKLIGDSITAGAQGTGYNYQDTNNDLIYTGYYENTAGTCWANSLRDYLNSKFSTVVKNYGVTGATAYTILSHIDDIVRDADDICIVCIGINDRGNGSSSYQLCYERVKAIYSAIIAKGKQCILMSEIPVSVTNETTDKNFHCEDIDNIYHRIAIELNIEYISLFKLFNEYCQNRGVTIDSLLAADGLHPNDDGYDVIFYLVSNALGFATKRPDATW